MEFGEEYHVGLAQNYIRSVMGSLKSTAESIREAIDRGYDPERAGRLNQLASQVWAMEGLARDVEHQLAQCHAEIRST